MVGLLVATSLLAVVLVPLAVAVGDLVFARSAAISPAAVAKIMLMSVLAPLLAGLLFRQWFPKADKASRAIMAIAGILLVVAVAMVLYGLWPITRNYIGNGLVLMLAIVAVLGLAVGHLLGAASRRPHVSCLVDCITASRRGVGHRHFRCAERPQTRTCHHPAVSRGRNGGVLPLSKVAGAHRRKRTAQPRDR